MSENTQTECMGPRRPSMCALGGANLLCGFWWLAAPEELGGPWFVDKLISSIYFSTRGAGTCRDPNMLISRIFSEGLPIRA